MFTINETIVPISAQRLDELYHIDIKKKAEKGTFSKTNFWYRKKNTFYNIGLYDSKTASLKNISIYHLDKNFHLENRIDAKEANWSGRKDIGWTMKEAIEIEVDNRGGFTTSGFTKIPLVIDEQPSDFYNMEKSAETLSYRQLSKYIDKLKLEGVSVTNYYVDLASKVSFPFVNFIVILIAFPIALISARSGNITVSFAIGIAIGFGYYVVHAISLSLGNAELIPIIASAWTANILLGCIGGYFMSGMEYKH